MRCLSRVVRLASRDGGNGTPDVISRCLLSIMQGLFRVEKNMKMLKFRSENIYGVLFCVAKSSKSSPHPRGVFHLGELKWEFSRE